MPTSTPETALWHRSRALALILLVATALLIPGICRTIRSEVTSWEALCGIIAEQMDIIGGDRWIVPAFLFRFHEEARLYLTRLIIGEGVGVSITGRTGSDFIAVCLDENGSISKYLVGEAKCHKRFNVTKCGKALNKLSKEASTPVSLPQLGEILKDINPASNESLIASMDDIFINKKLRTIPRIDIFLYAFDDAGVQHYNSVRITDELRQEHYRSKRKIHALGT